jgi:integrase
MARRRADNPLDLDVAQDLTAGRIAALSCPQGKGQAFLRDTKAPGLRVRVTASGAKSFVFEGKLRRQTIRLTVGDARAWTIDAARVEANRLRVLLDGGIDPREVERQRLAEIEAKAEQDLRAAQAAEVASVKVSTVWSEYLAERRQHWGDLHFRDHVRLSKAGGAEAQRGTRGRGVTVAGPLHELMQLELRDLTAPRVEAWAAVQAKSRPTAARLAWRLLKAFLGWCAEQPRYAALLPVKNPAMTTRSREAFGPAGVKQDALLREQLSGWFSAVQQIQNPAVAAYLQALLLVGARPGELLELRWEDLNTQWKGLTIRDKVEGERVIPLTSYVSHLLLGLPRRGDLVFAGLDPNKSMSKPHKAHATACAVAGVDGLTLHGLRRSFRTLAEWLEVPSGLVAQIMGHKPSATAEKHYTVRPLDMLRIHHQRIESWIIKQARIKLPRHARPRRSLRLVA